MSDNETPRDCEHGQLARSCEVCELKRELAQARGEREEAQSRIAFYENANKFVVKRAEKAEAERDSLLALNNIPDNYCLSCGGEGGHCEGCVGTTGLMALKAERDALRADTERYRWYRDELLFGGKEFLPVTEADTPDSFDAAIDVARRKT